MLIFNACILILAVMDASRVQGYEFRESVGEAIVVINILVPIVSMIILAAKMIIIAYVAYKEWKTGAQKGREDVRDVRIEIPKRRKEIRVEDFPRKNVEIEREIAKKKEMMDLSQSQNQNDMSSNNLLNISQNKESSFQTLMMNQTTEVLVQMKMDERSLRPRPRRHVNNRKFFVKNLME